MRLLICCFAAALVLATPLAGRADAYSVLSHEAIVDAAWSGDVVPILKQRFPRVTEQQLLEARAYAYGGSIIQDLGYFPFGSKLFTNLVHYVRAGDFVEALVRESHTVNELAFALGALAHYAADNTGHPLAVNRAVPLMYPKDRIKHGATVLFAEAPAHHLMTEFAFDVLQVARGAYVAEAFRAFVGFEVAKELLERAFQETYGVGMSDLFADVDLAIGTYRWAVGTAIPEMTRIAWREKRDEIEQKTPGITRDAFIYTLQRRTFDREFGTKYRKPGFFSRVLAFTIRILPKVGPLRALAFKPLSAEAEKLFLESADRAVVRYRDALRQVRGGRIAFANTDFDTGQPVEAGRNPLADEAAAELVKRTAPCTAQASRRSSDGPCRSSR